MSGWLDNCRCPTCDCECLYVVAEKRNIISSVVAGTLFFIGWWMFIDAFVACNNGLDYHLAFMTCGFVSSLAFFMINAVSNAQVRGDTATVGCLGQSGARAWLLIAFFLAFGSLIGASYILFGPYVAYGNYVSVWPGVAVFLQNVFIFAASVVFKLGRTEELWE